MINIELMLRNMNSEPDLPFSYLLNTASTGFINKE